MNKTIRQFTFLAAIALGSLLTVSSANSSQLHYTVDLRNPSEHRAHISLKPAGFRQKKGSFQMPVWAPGAYSVSHYGNYVNDLKAFDKRGHELPVIRVNPDRWEFEDGLKVSEIKYDVLDSHKDSTSLYFAMANMDTNLVFANATAFFGYYDDDKAAPATVNYEKQTDWKLICSLPPSKSGYQSALHPSFQNTAFYASNYDVLVDAPVMASPGLQSRTFQDGSAVYDIGVYTQHAFSDEKFDSLSKYMKDIVHAETDFFHDTPFNHYSFLIYSPDLKHMPSYAQGALEHANSSDYLLMNTTWSGFKAGYLPIFSHEFFHLWDVKRIHSNLLGPFDYTKRVMTTSLWMAEGVTDYYAHSLLSRYRITTPNQFYAGIRDWVAALSQAKAKDESLENLSVDESDFHMENAMLFYIKGPLVAMALDIEIRNRTNNTKSLDDVMRSLNADAKQGKTFTEDGLIKKVEQYSGVDLTDFYNKYIHGSDSLPLDYYLGLMGLHRSEASASSGNRMAMGPDNTLVYAIVDTASPVAKAGITNGDRLIAINGTKITMDNVQLLDDTKASGRVAAFTIERAGQTLELRVDYSNATKKSRSRSEGWLQVDENATPLQNAIRKSIVGADN